MRFRPRHLQQTLARTIETRLGELGWAGSAINFGTTPVVVVEVQPDEVTTLRPNTVSVTLGDEPAEQSEEIGPLASIAFDLYVDIYGATQTMAVAISSDVRDILTNSVWPLLDYTTDPAGVDSGEQIEMEEVTVARPTSSIGAADLRRNWRVVGATAKVYKVES